MEPYKPPHLPAQTVPPMQQVIAVPFWIMRLLFGILGVVLLADGWTRTRPQLRPEWFGQIAVFIEFLAALYFLLIMIARVNTTLPAPHRSSEGPTND